MGRYIFNCYWIGEAFSSNPFLRKLFQDIAGFDLDDRLVWVVEELVNIFLASDVAAIMSNFGKSTQQEDPVIHFYETFLSAYDPKLRKSRGVWYTPQPVVNFIVRAVDNILKTEFNLPQGLADTSKVRIKLKVPTNDKRFAAGMREYEKEVHKVQILDPATGTGTFLAEVVRQIYQRFKGQEGIWNSYVSDHLLPRLNGFELLMASYAMAHLKMDMLLTETGYKSSKDQRFRIFLTNSLEEFHPDSGTLFSSWLSDEAEQANAVKRDTPVMVVMGNPPYNLSSFNKSPWIENLVEDYKNGLNEQNYNSLSDDYVKFIRFGQNLIDRNDFGVLAMITNNSFIDGITQRQMRKSLLNSFDTIYIYDLHGSTKRKEKSPDGSKDENVFDIQQGVSISLFIKRGRSRSRQTVFHHDSFGLRETKYLKLNSETLDSIKWRPLKPQAPHYFLVPKDTTGIEKYSKGFTPIDLFVKYGNGIKFRKDNLLVKSMYSRRDVLVMLNDINTLAENDLFSKYDFRDTPDWKLQDKKKLFIKDDDRNIIPISYRQFDTRFTYYPLNSINQIIVRGDSRKNLMQNYLMDENVGLIIGRQGQVVGDMEWNMIFISTDPTDMNIFYRGGGINFPLYIFPENQRQGRVDEIKRRIPNLNQSIIKTFEAILSLTFTDEVPSPENSFTPIDVLDFVYATLHSPLYRETYKEFLKTDFPRIPYPSDVIEFWKLVHFGRELREIHLLKSSAFDSFLTKYSVDGNNLVETVRYDGENVSINESQYFAGVPKIAWEFYIGGYQPAQKWLKDRKGRQLDFQDILHYQKIIKALVETDRIMQEIHES